MKSDQPLIPLAPRRLEITQQFLFEPRFGEGVVPYLMMPFRIIKSDPKMIVLGESTTHESGQEHPNILERPNTFRLCSRSVDHHGVVLLHYRTPSRRITTQIWCSHGLVQRLVIDDKGEGVARRYCLVSVVAQTTAKYSLLKEL